MKKYIFLIVSVCSLGVCWAVPARRGARQVEQADGTLLTLYTHGDEHFHWHTDEQGRWLRRNEAGNYVALTAQEKEDAVRERQQVVRQVQQQTTTASPTNTLPRGLVILAEYQDVAFATPRDTIDSMLNAENFTRNYTYTYGNNIYQIKASGSARKYFEASSFGHYSPRFDVVGPYKVSRNMAYYGSDTNGKDAHVRELIVELCQMAIADGVDLSLYDGNGDKKVDYVGVIFAGYGQADGGSENTIWPHKSSIEGENIFSKGYKFALYNCNPEKNFYTKHYMGIGTFCHEFGHVMGLPDIYSTNGSTVHKTCGEWDIMDYGCYVHEGDAPPLYTGYERFFFGWTTPRVLDKAENVSLNALEASNEVLMITSTGKSNLKGTDPDPSEFYLLENRQQVGFDRYLPGHGLILTKINYSYTYWYSNIVNNSASNMRVDIIEADGLAPEYDATGKDRGWFGKAGDAFPEGATEYRGIKDYPITQIEESADGVITFLLKGGAPTGDALFESESELEKPVKIIQNGQLMIHKNGIYYTPSGAQLPNKR